MYVTEVQTASKSGPAYRCVLLRESYREAGKVKNRTVANLSHCKPEEIAALRLALEHKDNLAALGSIEDSVRLQEGLSVGAVWTVYTVAKRVGIETALGRERAGKLALWQVMARVIDQGSRLSAVRLAQTHAGCDVLGIARGFDENDLYENLGWLSGQQAEIEQRLFRARPQGEKTELFLYDVTSSYLEGTCNALGDWGYNRDGKRGKKQVVVGLLCDAEGEPVSVEVFQGNTSDVKTFAQQIQKVAKRFGCERVTMVGDRGLIKSGQIDQLKEEGFCYITALTKPQIEKLIVGGVIQLSWFDEQVCEVEKDGVRYVLRRNPQRAEDLSLNRQQKRASVARLLEGKNTYLAEHPRAKVDVALRALKAKIVGLKVEGWLRVGVAARQLQLEEDSQGLAEQSRLDGCYVIKSDLPKPLANAQTLHDRYKDLTQVEQAFRTSKSAHLEMRPWYVRIEKSTRGHALVVMLAYLIIRHLQQAWSKLNITVEEGLKQLATLCSIQVVVKGETSCHQIPSPREQSAELLKAVDIHLPKALPQLGARVVTRRKLTERRTKH
ncbi:MAG: IS1634 family transposase [Pyrinomonadaceae bacterium]